MTRDVAALDAEGYPMGETETLREALDETFEPYLVITKTLSRRAFDSMLDGATDRLRYYHGVALTRDDLGAAWARAEAALPDEGLWQIQGVQLVDTSDSDDLNDEQLEWEAEAVDHRRGGQPRNITALGPTPTAALLALAEKLEGRT